MTVAYPIIEDIIPRTQAVASASQSIFSTTWTANTASDIVVYSRASDAATNDVTQLVSDANYDVAFIGDENIVQVTFIAGQERDAGDIVTIIRNTPTDRMNLYTNTIFTPSMLNSDFGTQVLTTQQNQLYNQVITPKYSNSARISTQDQDTGLGGDQILPILGANQIWIKNEANTEIIPLTLTDEVLVGVLSITGTANQVITSAATGNITLSLPQDIGTTSAVEFGQLIVDNLKLSGNTLESTDVGGNITLIADGTGNVDVFAPPASESSSISIDGASYNAAFRVNDIGSNAPAQMILHRHSTTLEPVFISARSNSDTDSHANVTNNMPLYSHYACGWTGTTYSIFGGINVLVDSSGSISDTSAPGKLILATTKANETFPTTALTIESDQSATFASTVTGLAAQFTTLQLTAGNILDANGNVALSLGATASAVNYLKIDNAPGVSNPSVLPAGTATDLGINFTAKGTGGFSFSTTTVTPIGIYSGTTYQHLTAFTFANTAASRTVTFPDATGTVLMTGQAISTVPSINFGGSTLSNYTEGTFTPTIYSTGGGSTTYNSQAGSYNRIGNRVFFECAMTIDTPSFGAGQMLFSLPVASNNTSYAYSYNVYATALSAGSITSVTAATGSGDASFGRLFCYAAGVATAMVSTQVLTGSVFIISGSYIVT